MSLISNIQRSRLWDFYRYEHGKEKKYMEFVSFDGGRSIDLKLFENKNKACKKVLKESTNKLDSLLLNYLLQLPSHCN